MLVDGIWSVRQVLSSGTNACLMGVVCQRDHGAVITASLLTLTKRAPEWPFSRSLRSYVPWKH